MTEFKIQVASTDHLRGQRRQGNKVYSSIAPFKGLFVTHIYQGRNENEGFFLKMMGVYPGVSDLLVIWATPTGVDFGFIEMKTDKGRLSPPQIKFKGICQAFGIKWALCRTVRQVHDTVKGWGAECVHDTVIEPDLRTKEEKYEALHKAMWT